MGILTLLGNHTTSFIPLKAVNYRRNLRFGLEFVLWIYLTLYNQGGLIYG